MAAFFSVAGRLTQSLASTALAGTQAVNLGRAVALGPVLARLSMSKCAASVVGGAVAVGAVPMVVSALGFTGAGIAASSVAAKMMSMSAIANGGGVAAGGLVATLQSVGASGLSLSSKILLGAVGSRLGVLVSSL